MFHASNERMYVCMINIEGIFILRPLSSLIYLNVNNTIEAYERLFRSIRSKFIGISIYHTFICIQRWFFNQFICIHPIDEQQFSFHD
jgi:hypothetical protein